ncbi:MFS transporter [Humibacter ginsenosidimutans]|uniref:MFS transporter n=1 Tax=Humibacter ginsenosidimutans TaxID=2599293 RepID=A0A5B8M7C9_9MICO|nr:MFS transporter [Humibacter ginsenosidimutans]QDZ15575.1 MFS transporter [Humibacter ginsenosidimutans]
MPRSATLNRPLALLAAVGLSMENLDGTIIQTAAPAMAHDFGVRAVDLNIAMTAYLLTVAVCVPVSGWLADRFGERRVFTTALAIFTVASALCAFAPSLPLLTAARVLQGIGGAMMVPVGRLAVLRGLDRRDLLDAMAYLTWPGLLAPVVAPALGGILTDTVGWPWIFLINIPFGIAAFIAALKIVPNAPQPEPRRLDWAGFGLTGVALAALVLGMEEVGAASTDWAWAAIYLVVAAVAGVTGVVWMRRARHPLLDFSALRIDTFRVGNVGGGVYRLIISAAPFLFTLLFQVGFGWSAARAGLLVGAVFVGNIAIKPATTPLIRRFGFKNVIVGSNLLGALVYVGCVFIDPTTPIWLIVVLLFLSGVFRSIGFSGYNSLQFADVPSELMTRANTLASTMQQVAVGIGIAVAALIVRLTTTAASAIGPTDAWLGYRWALAVVAVLLVFPVVEAALLPRHAGSAARR